VSTTDSTVLPEAPGGRHRRIRLIVVVAVIVAIVVAAGIWGVIGARRYYAYMPGSAPQLTTSASCRPGPGGTLYLSHRTPCARLVVADEHGHDLDGRILMVDVLVGKATPLQYIEQRVGLLNLFHRGAQLLPNQAVLGDTPPAQYSCQDAQYMQQASQTAPVLALERLGYKVTYHSLGARVFQVNLGTPAYKAGIHCGDRILDVGGHPIKSADDVSKALTGMKPGQVVKVTVERNASHGKTKQLTVPVTLGRTPAADRAADKNPAFLGVAVNELTHVELPFHVEVQVGNIGGPSAGLAITLALLDTLSGGSLTGGHVVATTGTISPNGAVGSIGGVKQKTVAVERAGAQLFLVPSNQDDQTNCTDAKAVASSRLKVECVSTLDQALRDIQQFGGKVPPKLLH